MDKAYFEIDNGSVWCKKWADITRTAKNWTDYQPLMFILILISCLQLNLTIIS